MAIFRGFSTVNSTSQKKYVLTDYELIIQDLLNAFNTRLGERVMQPRLGCVAWQLLYEPLTEITRQQLYDNISEIVAADPRVTLDTLNALNNADQNTLLVELLLRVRTTSELIPLAVQFSQSGPALNVTAQS